MVEHISHAPNAALTPAGVKENLLPLLEGWKSVRNQAEPCEPLFCWNESDLRTIVMLHTSPNWHELTE